MKNIKIRLLGICIILSIFAISLFANPTSLKKQKIKPKELIAKHLQSIGSEERRKSIKSIMAVGTSKAIFRGRGTGMSEGIVVLASQSEKNMIGMKFNNVDYQFEKMGYDGDVFSVGYAKTGKHSVLGGFLKLNQKTFKNGLLGGALTTSWELLNYNEKKGKLKYAGIKKVDSKKLYKFAYNMKKGSDLNVALFFDTETFRHVRTEYSRVITSSLGRATGTGRGVATSRVDNSAQQSEKRQRLVEEFGDFRAENGLTLPHSYEMYLELQTGNGTIRDRWTMNLQRFYFNQNIDAKEFRVDGY